MASSKPIQCGPCCKEKVNSKHVKAGIWCYNCNEGLCSTCKSHHKRSKETHDHKTISIKSYKSSIPTIKTECAAHYQQLNLYCPGHLMPCCDVCISKSHSKCTGIKSLESEVDTTNIDNSKKFVDTEINSILNFLDKLVSTKSKSIKTGEQSYLGITRTVQEIKREINKHLDYLEMKMLKETNTIWIQEKLKATDFVTDLEEKLENLKVMKQNINIITERNNSKLQSFLGVHQIEKEVHQFQRYVANLENDERANKFDIKMKQNDEIESILSKLGSLKSFGELVVVKTDIDLNRETSVKREAQVQLREQSNINFMKMKIETKIETNIGSFISDMICLMDGRIVVVEGHFKVNLFNANGKFEKHLPISGGACSVTQISQDKIAISYPWEKAIKIFNIEKDTVITVIELEKACHGLSAFNNTLAVGLNGLCDDEILILNLKGIKLKSIQVHSESYLYNLVYHDERLIYSERNGKVVTCIDESGKPIWQYKQDLSGPEGLCTDASGNIIVADSKSNKIIVISKDGQQIKVLIDEMGGLKNPKCICFKHDESSGYIMDDKGTYLTKFSLSYGYHTQ